MPLLSCGKSKETFCLLLICLNWFVFCVFLRFLLLKRGNLIQDHNVTSQLSNAACLSYHCQNPAPLGGIKLTWHEVPAFLGLKEAQLCLLLMTQGKWGKASCALCAWRTFSLSTNFSHIMRMNTQKIVMSKDKLKVRSEGFAHSILLKRPYLME